MNNQDIDVTDRDDEQDGELDSTSAKNKAYRLRQKVGSGMPIKPSDAEFLKAYDAENPPRNIGARASRKVSYTEEESQAVGIGDAARGAVDSWGLAATTRQEGLRLDHIMQQGIGALVRACELHEKMAAGLGCGLLPALQIARQELVPALEGLSFDSVKGRITFRKEDHQALSDVNYALIGPASNEDGWEVVDFARVDGTPFAGPPTPGTKMKLE